ncbi:hypothetical protein J6590_029270 [Homalodisca vitripennis]|nr:hypothetical protein J6590_029270 [Homalodisca vitripennis]
MGTEVVCFPEVDAKARYDKSSPILPKGQINDMLIARRRISTPNFALPGHWPKANVALDVSPPFVSVWSPPSPLNFYPTF